jgi:AcrR family transcriptional regulator
MPNLRERVRAEIIAEIKAAARRQLADEGANLNLRAIARELGMASSAIYRYFASRDDLLTALIIEAYDAMGEAAEKGEAAVPRDDFAGRYAACWAAIRDWSRAHPHQYALIYGSPVPGYRAPADTIGPAARPVAVLAGILRDAVGAGLTVPPEPLPVPDDLAADLRRIGEDALFAGIPPELLLRGLTAWAQTFGAISFDLFGRLNNVISARDSFFARQVTEMTAYVGIPGAAHQARPGVTERR